MTLLNNRFHIVIPVRYAASRLPGKPLLDIGGKPMVQHVYERACLSDATSVVIATDDHRISDVAEAFGAQVCLTRDTHPSGTARITEVISRLSYDDEDIIVNVQGDEPFISHLSIHKVVNQLRAEAQVQVATLCVPIKDTSELLNPNVVKVVLNKKAMALYFSRAPIASAYRHIGLYAYRVHFFKHYQRWGVCALEQEERLEQLRILWNGMDIVTAICKEEHSFGVDTEEDLIRARLAIGK